jgi:hypothetical protein
VRRERCHGMGVRRASGREGCRGEVGRCMEVGETRFGREEDVG